MNRVEKCTGRIVEYISELRQQNISQDEQDVLIKSYVKNQLIHFSTAARCAMQQKHR